MSAQRPSVINKPVSGRKTDELPIHNTAVSAENTPVSNQPQVTDTSTPLQNWPEWLESEIATEKWASKTAFEDPENCFCTLPISVRSKVAGLKRVGEVLGETSLCIVSPTTLLSFAPKDTLPGKKIDPRQSRSVSRSPSILHMTNTQEIASGVEGLGQILETPTNSIGSLAILTGTKKKEIESVFHLPVDLQAGNSISQKKFTQANEHLLKSTLFQKIISSLTWMLEQDPKDAKDFHPWDAIYPRGKDGVPSYNPSGKYAVKLFWLGSWRKIFIDDRIPVSSDGKPLLVSSAQPTELWPLLISKAIIKLSSACFDDRVGFSEEGDFDFLSALRGWTPENILIDELSVMNIISVLQLSNGIWTPEFEAKAEIQVEPDKNVKTSISTALPTTPCGYRIPFLILKRTDGHEDIYPYHTINKIENGEFQVYSLLSGLKSNCKQLSMTDFASEYSSCTLYHDQANYRSKKTFKNSSSASENLVLTPSVFCKPIFVSVHSIDVNDDSKDTTMLISLSSVGKKSSEHPCDPTVIFIQRYDWMNTNTIEQLQCEASTNGVGFLRLNIPAGLYAFKYIIYSPQNAPWHVSLFSESEVMLEDEISFLQKQKLFVQDFDETTAPLFPYESAVLSCISFKLKQDTFISCQVYTTASSDQHLSFGMVDKDTNSKLCSAFFRPLPMIFPKNKKGYVGYVEVQTTINIPSIKYKVRIISESPFDESFEELPVLNSKVVCQEIEDVNTNKHSLVLFRYNLTHKSETDAVIFANLRYMNKAIHLKLEVIRNGVVVGENFGLGCVNLRHELIDVHENESEAKYVLQGTIDEFDHLVVECATQDQPEWQIEKQAAAIKKKGINSIEIKTSTKLVPHWKLRLMSFDAALVSAVKDNELEDKFKEMKKSWENGDSSRAAKAKEVRDAYLKLVEAGQVKPFFVKTPSGRFIKPWTILNDKGEIVENSLKKGILDKIDLRIIKNECDVTLEQDKDYTLLKGIFPAVGYGPKVLSLEDKEKINLARKSKKEEYENTLLKIQEFKALMTDRSKKINEKGAKLWDDLSNMFEKFSNEDNAVREECRLAVVKKLEEEAQKKIAEEALNEEGHSKERRSAKKR